MILLFYNCDNLCLENDLLLSLRLEINVDNLFSVIRIKYIDLGI